MLLSSVAVLFQMAVAIRPDDGRLLRDAQKAQVRFETVRRTHLPWDRSGGSPGRCDAQIGRYCYWYDSTQSTAVPEPLQITDARTRLLALMDSAARVQPTSGWVAGQRVRYLLEAGRAPDAVGAARVCRAEPWWCAALEGLALHVAERYAEADSVFTVALDAMPPPQRCEWVDLRRMTEGGPLERELSRASCRDRETLANQLWALGRPLWSMPGNDLRSEHFARHTMAAVLSRSANAHGMTWSGDSEELLIRYGWSEWFTRQGPDIGGMSATPRVTGHDREPSYHFFPAIESLRQTPRLVPASWSLRAPLARTRYAPRYLKRMGALRHQLARFPRGDSTMVVAAYRIADTALAKDSVTAWLCHSGRGERTPARCARNDSERGLVRAIVSREPFTASVEVRGNSTMRAERARYSVDPLPCSRAWCLSDLLLFHAPGASRAGEVDSVLRSAASELTFANHAPLGVFWEIQRDGHDAVPVWVSLTVSPVRASLARRVATRLRIVSERSPISLRWQAMVRSEREGEHVTLRLPSNARGTYRVHLTVEAPGIAPLNATREIDVVR